MTSKDGILGLRLGILTDKWCRLVNICPKCIVNGAYFRKCIALLKSGI